MSALLSLCADMSDALMKSPPFMRGVMMVVVAMVSLRVMYAIRRPETRRKTPFADRAWAGNI